MSVKSNNQKLSKTLKQIQLHAQVQVGHSLTHEELAALAGVNKRSLGDWMRGTSSPSGMGAVFELLSTLDDGAVKTILKDWRTASPSKSTKKFKGE